MSAVDREDTLILGSMALAGVGLLVMGVVGEGARVGVALVFWGPLVVLRAVIPVAGMAKRGRARAIKAIVRGLSRPRR